MPYSTDAKREKQVIPPSLNKSVMHFIFLRRRGRSNIFYETGWMVTKYHIMV